MKLFLSTAFFGIFLLAKTNAETPLWQQWLADLGRNDQQQSHRMGKLVFAISHLKDPEREKTVKWLGQQVNKEKNQFLNLRFTMLRAFLFNNETSNTNKPAMLNEVKQLLETVKQTGNKMLLADYYYLYAGILALAGKTEEALFFHMKSMEMVEQLGPHKFTGANHRFNILGELLYHTREYEKSIVYSKKAYLHEPDTAKYRWKIITLNTIGLAYKKLGLYDSAIRYFNQSKQKAIEDDFLQWVTIPDANKAQILFEQKKYAEARALFQADYHNATTNNDPGNAANNLQWLAKTDLAENKTDSALYKAKQALNLLQPLPAGSYLANTYETLAAVYGKLNNTVEAERYAMLYREIHDKTEQRMAMSRSEIVQLRLNDEKSQAEIALLEQERLNEKTKRNAFIGFVLLSALITWLLYNRQRNRQKQEQQQKETELAAAREKMQLFIQTIAEKSELIEQLQVQAEQARYSPELQQHLDALKQKTILTENDWAVFKTTFEKIYPGFFQRVKKINPDITTAELRFAALVRLEMNNREAGSMLGISADSARKSRQRLRQRLNLGEDDNLEVIILNI